MNSPLPLLREIEITHVTRDLEKQNPNILSRVNLCDDTTNADRHETI